jgi:hypothetical protein
LLFLVTFIALSLNVFINDLFCIITISLSHIQGKLIGYFTIIELLSFDISFSEEESYPELIRRGGFVYRSLLQLQNREVKKLSQE